MIITRYMAILWCNVVFFVVPISSALAADTVSSTSVSQQLVAPLLPPAPVSMMLLSEVFVHTVVPLMLFFALGCLWYFKGQLRKKTAELKGNVDLLQAEVIAREQMNKENIRLLSIMEQTLDAVFIFSLENLRFFYVNQAAVQHLGYSRDELLTMTPLDIKPDLDESHCRDMLWPLQNGKATDATFETVHRNKDGRLIPVEIYMKYMGSEEHDTFFIAIVRDITVRKNIEQEKLTLERELRQVQKMEAIGVLAGGITHDFNNILSAILGYGDLALMELAKDSQAYKDISEVLIAGKRAKALVNRIASFNRKSEPKKGYVYPRQVLNETVTTLKAILPSSIIIGTDIKGENVTIWGDSTQLLQIIINLCVNASHAMAEKGELFIELTTVRLSEDDLTHSLGHEMEAGMYVSLAITDTGTGIDDEVLPRIFEPFFTTKEVGKGTGMGLSVVNDLVKDHGGMIKVASKLGKGTTFTVFFPVSYETVDVQDQLDFFAEDLPEDEQVEHAHLLVVDDEYALRQLYKGQLERVGYQVTLAADGQFAFDLFSAQPDSFDLLITDQTMPRKTGLDLIREVRMRRPELPVILNSGYSSAIDPDVVRECGINCYARKPIDFNDLLRDVRLLLRADTDKRNNKSV